MDLTVDTLTALTAVVIISLTSLVGVVFFLFSGDKLGRIVSLLVPVAVGLFMAMALFHMMPKIILAGKGWALVPLLGFLLFMAMSKLLHSHHKHVGTEEKRHFGFMCLIGSAVHSFVDGFIVVSAFLVDAHLGVGITLAVVFHEIPKKMVDFGVLVHQGYSNARSLLYSTIAGSFALIGGATVLLAGPSDALLMFIIGIGAGGFIHVAGFDIGHEMEERDNPLLQTGLVATGMMLVVILDVIFHH